MKKILMILAVMAVVVLVAAGCTDELDKGVIGGDPIFLMPQYIGEEISDVNHTFSKDEFQVYVCYDDGSTKEVTDYEITETKLEAGAFTVYVKWRKLEGDAYIVLNKSAFMEQMEQIRPSEETAE